MRHSRGDGRGDSECVQTAGDVSRPSRMALPFSVVSRMSETATSSNYGHLRHSSICLPKNAAATCASFTSPSLGATPVSGWMKHTAPVMSPAARMGETTAA